jgi:hypothetical protein
VNGDGEGCGAAVIVTDSAVNGLMDWKGSFDYFYRITWGKSNIR